jgi:hypothetical protein
MDYDKLILEHTVKKLAPDVLIDIKDYYNMGLKNLPRTVKWENIKSYVITTDGKTLWRLSEEVLNSEFRPIGCLEPPLSLIEWIIKKQQHENI